ncbi:MAG: hypothetical protein HFI13_09710 [Lachnospiraceae bacterium]|nr:hypothetical protein [Lachnospiraceae bacterium]
MIKNIYDIRKSRQFLFVLPKNVMTEHTVSFPVEKCAVFVNLYYLDAVSQYMAYINQIPEMIQIYIYSSDQKVLECAFQAQLRPNIQYHLKENRGRDISTLLVAAKNEILKYEYICFLHDKKANADYLKEDVDTWINNLWGNTVGSACYIYNVLNIFKRNKDIGLLVPPEAFGATIPYWYGDNWMEDYYNCRKLAGELGLRTNISKDKDVFTIGTVFWSRTKALKKLLEKEWIYENFPEEPMPIDGTLSHAIEKILGYVAQDAGYHTGTIMSEQYASWLLLMTQEYMKQMFSRLQKKEHIHNIAQLISLEQREHQIKAFYSRYKRIYIYGAGDYGISLLYFVRDRGWNVEGFVVSTGRKNAEMVEGYKVLEIQELHDTEDFGILIGVSYEFREEVESVLRLHHVENYIYGF